MRAAIYCRVSKGEEGEETSTAIQEKDCRALCELRGWEVAEVFTDVGISGFDPTAQRPRYDALLDAARERQVDVVVVYKLDRLTRQLRQLLDIVDMLEQTGVGLASVNDPEIDTTSPMGRLVLKIMGAVAELESETIRLRVRRGVEAQAQAGKPHMGGTRPYGWADDRVTLHPEESKILRTIIDRFVAGEGMRSVLRDEAPDLLVSSVMSALRRPRLIGKRIHKGHVYDSEIEPLIDMETWDRLQRRIGGRTELVDGVLLTVPSRKWKAGEVQLLGQGLVGCSVCGDTMVFSGKKTATYTCRGRACQAVKAGVLEEIVASEVRVVLTGLETMRGSDADRRQALQDQARAVEGRLERLRTLWVDLGDLTADEYRQRRDPLVQELEQVEAGLASLQQRSTFGGRRRGALTLDEWWDAATPVEQHQAVRHVVERVEVRPANEVREELMQRYDQPGGVGWRSVKDKWTVVTKARIRIHWREDL